MIGRHLPVRFHFSGTLIHELSDKVKNNATIHGEISDPLKMSSLLSGMNIALLTSSYEGFPMFIKESMAHGCIPVVTALPGNLTHLTDGVNCLLIHEIQDEDLVVKEAIDKIMELSGNKLRCMELSGNAYQYAKANFNRTRFNESYQNLFR